MDNYPITITITTITTATKTTTATTTTTTTNLTYNYNSPYIIKTQEIVESKKVDDYNAPATTIITVTTITTAAITTTATTTTTTTNLTYTTATTTTAIKNLTYNFNLPNIIKTQEIVQSEKEKVDDYNAPATTTLIATTTSTTTKGELISPIFATIIMAFTLLTNNLTYNYNSLNFIKTQEIVESTKVSPSNNNASTTKYKNE
jgi:hypothetical protein